MSETTITTLAAMEDTLSLPSHANPPPSPPSATEARDYYHGLYTKPRLIARSSTEPWIEWHDFEARRKELSPLGSHPLQEIWESTIGPDMVRYLDANGVNCSSLDPVRIGYENDASPPAIIWVGVLPNTLTSELGVKVAARLKNIVTSHGIHDVDVELRESEVFFLVKFFGPACEGMLDTISAFEPFSTSVGIPISPEANPSVGGTGGLFLSDSRFPGKYYLATARHVVFRADSKINSHFERVNTSQRRKNVLIFSDHAAGVNIAAVETALGYNKDYLSHLERKLEDEVDESARARLQARLTIVRNESDELDKLLREANQEWKNREQRVIGHVILSPPIGTSVGEEGFTEDWAIIEIDAGKIDKTNFVGNVVDLGADIPRGKIEAWMYPLCSNQPSFKYPQDRLHRIIGTIPDEEMWKPNPKNVDQHNDPVIMVLKRGLTTGLTVGRLNNIRSLVRYPFKDQPLGAMSKEVVVLPRDSKSGPFSERGDSGSSAVDGAGRLAGLLTAGAGDGSVSDLTYVASINFLKKRMLLHGMNPNFFPTSTPNNPGSSTR